jgi:hypothetical protein
MSSSREVLVDLRRGPPQDLRDGAVSTDDLDDGRADPGGVLLEPASTDEIDSNDIEAGADHPGSHIRHLETGAEVEGEGALYSRDRGDGCDREVGHAAGGSLGGGRGGHDGSFRGTSSRVPGSSRSGSGPMAARLAA